MRFLALAFLILYLLVFAAQNTQGINVSIPFYREYHDVPLFLLIISCVIMGMTLQFLTSFGSGKKK